MPIKLLVSVRGVFCANHGFQFWHRTAETNLMRKRIWCPIWDYALSSVTMEQLSREEFGIIEGNNTQDTKGTLRLRGKYGSFMITLVNS